MLTSFNLRTKTSGKRTRLWLISFITLNSKWLFYFYLNNGKYKQTKHTLFFSDIGAHKIRFRWKQLWDNTYTKSYSSFIVIHIRRNINTLFYTYLRASKRKCLVLNSQLHIILIPKRNKWNWIYLFSLWSKLRATLKLRGVANLRQTDALASIIFPFFLCFSFKGEC